MTVAEPASSRPAPPTPEECQHAAPVVGVMAHEFSPYRGAVGPEGTRRTTMYYGPVVGGLPVGAWHCEDCGLLRLTFYDGRKEERRLWPGPQPDLIAGAVAGEVTPEAGFGTQSRVSGLSIPAELEQALLPPPVAGDLEFPTIDLPDLGWSGWLTSLLIGALLVELVVLMVGAVAGSTTSGYEGGVAVAAAITFGLALLTPVGFAGMAHFFPMPQLGPSPAEVHRGRPQMDGITWTLVWLLILVVVFLTLLGVLAIYDWRTPAVERPLAVVTGALFTVAVLGGIAGFTGRRLTRRG